MPAKRISPRERLRVEQIYVRLTECYPEVRCTLEYKNPFQLLVMTILAAQCTDARVNQVCRTLFQQYVSPADFVAAPPGALEEAIRSCGFFNQKARSIRESSAILLAEHEGEVPSSMEALLRLPGVGRKIANVVLGECFGEPSVVVDTHCMRVSRRLGFTKNTTPEKIEKDLMQYWPREYWTRYSHFMVFHGRAACRARGPLCTGCCLAEWCPYPSRRNKALSDASK